MNKERMVVWNHTQLPEEKFQQLATQIPAMYVLTTLLTWFFGQLGGGKFTHRVIEQDEYSHDHVMSPWQGYVLVFDTN